MKDLWIVAFETTDENEAGTAGFDWFTDETAARAHFDAEVAACTDRYTHYLAPVEVPDGLDPAATTDYIEAIVWFEIISDRNVTPEGGLVHIGQKTEEATR